LKFLNFYDDSALSLISALNLFDNRWQLYIKLLALSTGFDTVTGRQFLKLEHLRRVFSLKLKSFLYNLRM